MEVLDMITERGERIKYFADGTEERIELLEPVRDGYGESRWEPACWTWLCPVCRDELDTCPEWDCLVCRSCGTHCWEDAE